LFCRFEFDRSRWFWPFGEARGKPGPLRGLVELLLRGTLMVGEYRGFLVFFQIFLFEIQLLLLVVVLENEIFEIKGENP
jgi:hypothetical protein